MENSVINVINVGKDWVRIHAVLFTVLYFKQVWRLQKKDNNNNVLRYCISSNHRTSALEVFLENAFRYVCSAVNLLHIFRTLFSKITIGGLLPRSVKKHCEAKLLQSVWKTSLDESTCSYNSWKFSYKFPKQESVFQQVRD